MNNFKNELKKPKYWLLIIAGLIILYYIVYPLFQIFLRSFYIEGEFTLEHYREVFTNRSNYTALLNSLFVSIFATIFATLLGSIIAFIVVRTNIPYKNILRFLFMVPFAIPPLFAAMGWVQLLGPVGYISRMYQVIFDTRSIPWDIYSSYGIIFVLTVTMYPFVFLIVSGSLQKMDSSLEEVARVSGSSNFQIMRHITLPLVKTAILAGAVLAFISSIDNFGIPAVLGLRVRYYVLTTRIYEALNIPDMPLATSMSVILVLIAIGAVTLLRKLEGAREQYAVVAGKSVRPSIIKLGWAKPLVMLFIFFILIFFVLLPVGSLFLTSFINYWGAPLNFDNLTFENFQRIFLMEGSSRGIRNSVFLAFVAATILIFVSSTISLLNIKEKIKGASLLDTLGMVPYALPGSVIGVSAILAWSNPPIGPGLYGTIWIFLAAYIMRYMAFGIRSTRSTLQQIDDSLEEVAQISGASRLRSFKDVTLPLLKPGMISGWILIFMPAVREVTVSVLIWSSGAETIGVMTFLYQDSGYPQRAAAMASIVIPIILVLYLVSQRLETGSKNEVRG